MRLCKKSDKIMVGKLNGDSKIIVFVNNIDLLKQDIKMFNVLIKPLIIDISNSYNYIIITGNGYNSKAIGFNSFNEFINNCIKKPFTGGILSDFEIDLLKRLNC